MKALLIFLTMLSFIISCGSPAVSYDKDLYEPKIVVDAYLYPQKPIKNIIISRNFPVDYDFGNNPLYLSEANVQLTDSDLDKTVRLTFDPDQQTFEYTGSDFEIGFDKNYRLDVSAEIDGHEVKTSATVHTPQEGFKITSVNHTKLPYLAIDDNGNEQTFELQINRSPGIIFYFAYIKALDVSTENAIFDNPFEDFTQSDLEEDADDLAINSEWISEQPYTSGTSYFSLPWEYNFLFYGRYQITIVATDNNFKDYIASFDNVQEFDGNFHEPRFHLGGDGIGVFASAVMDTIYVNVSR